MTMLTLFLCLVAIFLIVRRLPEAYLTPRRQLGLILITRNHAEVIEGIVRGLCWLAHSQQQELEIVLVDNASTDGTYRMNEVLSKEYLHIHAVSTNEFQKSEALVKLGLPLCRAEVVYYCKLPTEVSRRELLPLFHRLFGFMDKEQKPLYLHNGLVRLQMLITGLQYRKRVKPKKRIGL